MDTGRRGVPDEPVLSGWDTLPGPLLRSRRPVTTRSASPGAAARHVSTGRRGIQWPALAFPLPLSTTGGPTVCITPRDLRLLPFVQAIRTGAEPPTRPRLTP